MILSNISVVIYTYKKLKEEEEEECVHLCEDESTAV